MAKKRRPRLTDGDKVKVVGHMTPGNFKGRVGKIIGVRGTDKMWTVIFSKRSLDWSVFGRHELKKVNGA